MKKTKKALAVGVAALLACGTLAGCDALTTTDTVKDYAQTVAEVNITESENFEKEFGADYKGFIQTSKISKQEMVASFISNYSYLAQYGYDVSGIFDLIAESLATRQIRVQYAVAYLAKKYASAEGEDKKQYADGDLTAFNDALKGDLSEEAAAATRLAFFLTDEEEDKAKYDLRVTLNSSLDSTESNFIKSTDAGDFTPDSDVRTRPTDAETENEDYYATEAHYRIYTGLTSDLKDNEYEPQEGSTPTTRKSAYNRFIASLRANGMLRADEGTADIEKTSYFNLQLKSQYETALLDKVDDILEEEASDKLTEKFATDTFRETLDAQKEKFEDQSSFETDFNGVSDTSFILASNDRNYGYVINILLPFSTLQTNALSGATSDTDGKGTTKYKFRQELLRRLVATDQRTTWFTGKENYSYEAAGNNAYNGGDDTRKYLFFENSFSAEDEGKYETLKNYYGNYTFNGTVEVKDGKYIPNANRIDIDGFLEEMNGYLGTASDLTVTFDGGYTPGTPNAAFYNTEDFTYGTTEDGHKAGDIDYSKFVYAKGKVTAKSGAGFDANEMFVRGTWENTALSIINELSFAYNTDTAGLNTYLGYMISPYKTSFVAEFEYAAQTVVREGAGSFIVVPSDYGWHIIYCTFSFADMAENSDTPYSFNYNERKGGTEERENSFSYLYFETLKAKAVESYLSEQQTEVRKNYYKDGTTIYEDVFADFKNLG